VTPVKYLSVTALVSAWVLAAVAAEGGPVRCLTPAGGFSPAFFPDGQRLVFVRETDEGDQHLLLLDLERGKEARVGEIDAVERPAVSPDGRWIAYVAGPVFARHIWIVDPNEPAPKRVTDRAAVRSAPSWIDGGKRLAVAEGKGEKQQVVSIDPFAEKPDPQVLEKLGKGTPTFSPCGKLAAMVTTDQKGTRHLRVVDREGRLVAEMPPVESSGGISVRGCYDPAFGPDGRYMVYVRSDIQPASDLHWHDLAKDRSLGALTSDRSDNQMPAVSPDGKGLAFVAAKQGAIHKIYLMDLDPPAPASQPAK